MSDQSGEALKGFQDAHHIAQPPVAETLGIGNFSLAVLRSIRRALGGDLGSIEHFQILMFLHLSAVAGRNAVPIRDLGGEVAAPYSTMVRKVDDLSKKGHLRKFVDPVDRRCINVVITDDAAAVIDGFVGQIRSMMVAMMQRP